MTQVRELLDLASAAPRPETDPVDDLARARSASRARAASRLQRGAAGLVAAALLVMGMGQVITDSPAERPQVAQADGEPVLLVAATLTVDPYTFDLTPRGWSVQDTNAYRVTIAPDDGSTSEEPDDFVGKLVILFDQNPPDGERVVHDGRGFWIRDGDSGYTTVATVTRTDEPPGVVRIQYPDRAGWSRASMLRFLGSVHVGPGALPGKG